MDAALRRSSRHLFKKPGSFSENRRVGEIDRDFASCQPYGKSILRVGHLPVESARQVARVKRRSLFITGDERSLAIMRIQRMSFVVLTMH